MILYAIFAVIVLINIAAFIFVIRIVSKAFDTGVIERKNGLKPITRLDTPAAYWTVLSIMAGGLIIVASGYLVIAGRLLGK